MAISKRKYPRFRTLVAERVEARVLLTTVPFSDPIVFQDRAAFPDLSAVWLNDVDLDGDLDVVTKNRPAGMPESISWQLNEGGGTFGNREVPQENRFSSFVHNHLADMDGDGDSDFLWDDGGIVWAANQFSDGQSFNFAEPTRTDLTATILGVADFNADGLDDLLVRNGWAENLGQSGFQLHDLGWGRSHATIMTDFDQDGDLDLVTKDGPKRLVVHRNVGGETQFSSPDVQEYEFGNTRFYQDFVATDVDQDGDEDLFFLDVPRNIQQGTKMLWFENQGDSYEPGAERVFLPDPDDILGFLDTPLDVLMKFDATGDGQLDLIFRNRRGETGWYEDPFASEWIDVEIPSGYRTAPGDIDGDGDQDWVGFRRDGEIRWFDGFASDDTAMPIRERFKEVEIDRLVHADFDNDGAIDLLVFAGSKLSWYRNSGNGVFAESQTIIETDGTLAVIDVNNDNLPDVVNAGGLGDGLNWWFPNLGTGKIGGRLALPTDRDFAFVDIDGDNDLDWHSVDDGQGQVQLNDGAGQFGGRRAVPGNRISAADVDADGDMDLISTDSQSVTWYENLGGENYGPSVVITSTAAVELDSYLLSDLDGDGDLDAIFTLGSGHRPSAFVFEFRDGRFNQLDKFDRDLGIWLGASAFRLADIDNDGDMDIVSQSHNLAYLENLGGLRFELPQDILNVASPTDPSEITLGDFDSDGYIDLAWIRRDQIIWQRNLIGVEGPLATQLDIDRIFQELRGESSHPGNDWNGDGLVTQDDVEHLLVEEFGTRRGDVWLDGDVSFADFLWLSSNFGKRDAHWVDGDMDGDGVVGFADFLLLSAAFGK